MKRKVFFISDRTGITAEMFGQSLLSQFENVAFDETTIPFIDTIAKAEEACQVIKKAEQESGLRPIVFDTIVTPEIRQIIQASGALVLDFFHTFIGPLETELGETSGFRVGKTHSLSDEEAYDHRIEAVNFSLNNDDGVTTRHYDKADVILVGVSRCGKTPTSLYMAMQFGIKAANYPFTEDDMEKLRLPIDLKKHKSKIFGLTINPNRLHEIRTERRANSRYASLKQCQYEVREVESLYRREKIPNLNTTSRSVEELAAKILATTGIKRSVF
ncbi:posphoenolpyruvate synthetase regulatory kinase/phosphorylase PpsR [Aliikangiella coralliicola]|uniref:Putative phosphoenolpyruvate synthase regulatory protein n=1 Tax=Aliikangiella coralliicola TaxID=2592383 RepID=A0A545U5Z4_9GAMM|nr:pyruvate, water dikinase regulatory protein [Aliikangiella coralliicola]TQV84887.1 kinase/pyrophosphorylase [Aliikangiella coralliicola]